MAREIKCPWCGEAQRENEIAMRNLTNAQGDVVERRCAKCHKLLAAYLEDEGNFIPRIRKF